jgi:signal transduction histidine kinase
VNVAGRLWGALTVVSDQPFSFAEDTERRIADFAELVTAALANVDAREQLAASRARIVEAGYEERRRLERDLHDGAQQELVGVVLGLRLAQQKLTSAPTEARELVDEALERAQAGIRDLRDLAAGIHPSVLTDRGLGPALEALAGRCPVPVEVETAGCEGLPASVATTAYFVVAEALTNAAKHARCEHIEVSVRVEGEWAVVEVHDDGDGGADASTGSGLRGLADRVSALGGRLEIESPVGDGTTVRARIAASGAAVRLPAHGNGG